MTVLKTIITVGVPYFPQIQESYCLVEDEKGQESLKMNCITVESRWTWHEVLKILKYSFVFLTPLQAGQGQQLIVSSASTSPSWQSGCFRMFPWLTPFL